MTDPNPPIPREPNRPVSQRLVDEVIAAGGSLRVPRRPWGAAGTGQPDYERRVALAEHRGVVPPGKRLVITRDRGELQIDLRDAPEGSPTAPMPVPVPERVARYHPVVAEFRGQHDRHEVSRAQLPRVSRILQGLVIEAERRGYAARLPLKAKVSQQGCPDWSGDADGHLLIVIGDVRVALRVREDGIRGRAIYPRYDDRYRDLDRASARANEYEHGAQGTVRISVIGPRTRSNRQSSWGDGKTQTLEQCLPAVLMEVEARAADERERIMLEQQAAERRQLAWEEAMERARRRHTEHHRIEALDAQVAAWRRATTIRDFCDAVEQQRPGDAAAAKWCAWARAYADGIDPLGTSLAIPDPPANVSPRDLEPFLDGWSPYGPERWAGRWR